MITSKKALKKADKEKKIKNPFDVSIYSYISFVKSSWEGMFKKFFILSVFTSIVFLLLISLFLGGMFLFLGTTITLNPHTYIGSNSFVFIVVPLLFLLFYFFILSRSVYINIFNNYFTRKNTELGIFTLLGANALPALLYSIISPIVYLMFGVLLFLILFPLGLIIGVIPSIIIGVILFIIFLFFTMFWLYEFIIYRNGIVGSLQSSINLVASNFLNTFVFYIVFNIFSYFFNFIFELPLYLISIFSITLFGIPSLPIEFILLVIVGIIVIAVYVSLYGSIGPDAFFFAYWKALHGDVFIESNVLRAGRKNK